MACTRKWRELIAGWRWMVAGKWWCPGPCWGGWVGGWRVCNCFRGALLEGDRKIWHNYTHPDNTWASGGMQYFLARLGVRRLFNPSAPFSCTLHTAPRCGELWPSGEFLESRRVVGLFFGCCITNDRCFMLCSHLDPLYSETAEKEPCNWHDYDN